MPGFQLDDVALSILETVLGERVRSALEAGHFEQDEACAMRGHFKPDDRLLDLGSGTGFIAIIAGRIYALWGAGTGRVFNALSRNDMVYCARRSVGSTVVFRRIRTSG